MLDDISWISWRTVVFSVGIVYLTYGVRESSLLSCFASLSLMMLLLTLVRDDSCQAVTSIIYMQVPPDAGANQKAQAGKSMSALAAVKCWSPPSSIWGFVPAVLLLSECVIHFEQPF
ncbi:hypothetical protein C2E23DRAFT_511979 [Lenzites betulinus]|nr:hypothetical protein C2E23DRAFT_511979 [Lenzites betulinus]